MPILERINNQTTNLMIHNDLRKVLEKAKPETREQITAIWNRVSDSYEYIVSQFERLQEQVLAQGSGQVTFLRQENQIQLRGAGFSQVESGVGLDALCRQIEDFTQTTYIDFQNFLRELDIDMDNFNELNELKAPLALLLEWLGSNGSYDVGDLVHHVGRMKYIRDLLGQTKETLRVINKETGS